MGEDLSACFRRFAENYYVRLISRRAMMRKFHASIHGMRTNVYKTQK